jgi:ring-1,2-phenylacetyl-CoA epoxidase subunit PaaD
MVDVQAAVAAVPDPELRALTIADLGILRGVVAAADGRVTVTITPTYTGCPAMEVIRRDIVTAARAAGAADVEVRTELSPPWSTDWISPDGRAKLAAAGIAPPSGRRARRGPVTVRLTAPGDLARGESGRRRPTPAPEEPDPVSEEPDPAAAVRCTRCGSPNTEELSRFGSTACKSLWRCRACREPFEAIKAH